MASATDIIVNLVAKTARFERGLNRANKSLTNIEKAAKTARFALRTVGVAMAGLASGRAAQVVRQQLAFAGNLERVSEVVGFNVEQIQELRFAGEQLNLEVRAIDLGMQRFSRRIAEAAQGQGELLKVQQKYDIQLRNSDGTMRENISILGDFADAIAAAESEQEQLRIAFKLFDSEGASLVRLLRDGSDGLSEFRDRAREAGVVVNQSMISEMAEADRQVNELSQALRAQLLRSVADNIGPLTEIIALLGELASVALSAATAIPNVAIGLEQAAIAIGQHLARQIHGDADAMSRLHDEIDSLVTFLEAARNNELPHYVDERAIRAATQRLELLRILNRQYLNERAAETAIINRTADAERARVAAAQAAADALPDVQEVDISDALLRVNTLMAERMRLARLVAESRTAEERILSNIRFITEAIHRGDGDINELLEVRRRLFVQLQAAMTKMHDDQEKIDEFGVQMARNLQSAMAETVESIITGQQDILAGFKRMLIRMVAELLARQLLLQFLGALSNLGGGVGSFFGKILAGVPKRHSGGGVGARQPVITGGPGKEELFVPNVSGRVIPGGGMGASVTIHQTNIYENAGGLTAEQAIELQQRNNELLKAEIVDELERGAYA